MKPRYLFAGIGIAAVIAVAVAVSLGSGGDGTPSSAGGGPQLGGGMFGPDLDTVLKNKDCDAAMNLSVDDLQDATFGDLAKLDLLLTECTLGG